MKEVFFFTPSIGFGGVTEITKKLSSGIASKGCEVFILTREIINTSKVNEFDGGVNFIELHDVKSLLAVKEKLRGKRIILTPSYYSVIFGFIFSVFFKSSCYYILDRKMSSYKDGSLYSKLFYYSNFILKFFTSGYICTYKAAFEDLTAINSFNKKNIKLIYYPVSRDCFTVKHDESKSYDLLYAGRLEPEKGVLVLLKALVSIREKYNKELRVCILGDGSLRNELEIYCVNNKLDKVYFKGIVNNVSHYMAKSRLFVLPSLSEGCSSVLKECIVVGIPSVVTDVDTGGPQEAIGYGLFGEISKVGCAVDLSNKIMVALDKNYSNEFRNNIIRQLSIDYAAKEYLDFIKS